VPCTRRSVPQQRRRSQITGAAGYTGTSLYHPAGMVTRRRIEEVTGATRLSIGTDGPVSLPRDSSETLALVLSRGLLCADRDEHATGRPLVYRPHP
jgi:hypothetical protein